MSTEDTESYYYAGEEKVQLEPDPEYIAVDLAQLGRGEEDSRIKQEVTASSQPLRRDLYLTPVSTLSGSDLERLTGVAAAQPVFRYGNARIVVLPEVRAELEEEHDPAALEKKLEEERVPAEVLEHRGQSVVLRPRSGRGDDALRLANLLREEGAAKFAQARQLRMIPRPKSD